MPTENLDKLFVVPFVWNGPMTDEAVQWVNERFPFTCFDDVKVVYRVGAAEFAFRYRRDAILFKLTWG